MKGERGRGEERVERERARRRRMQGGREREAGRDE